MSASQNGSGCTTPPTGSGSRLLFSQRAALDRAGVPTTGPEGALASDGWRAAWAAEEVIRLRVARTDEARALLDKVRDIIARVDSDSPDVLDAFGAIDTMLAAAVTGSRS